MPNLLRLLFALILIAGLPSAARAQAKDGQNLEAVMTQALRSVVSLRASVPPDARSARTLGSERSGHGVVIDGSGLILTIGYLILEAMAVTVTTEDGKSIPTEVVAYDYETGFGLLRPVLPLNLPALPIGDSTKLEVKSTVVVGGGGGLGNAMPAMVVSKREFAGYWEYLLDEAIFTSPPYENWGGAALLGLDGKLLGIGSLFVGDAGQQGDRTLPGNMFVPINLLKPILADLLTDGRSSGTPRPWLGLNTQVAHGALFVTQVTPGGPAEKAGVRQGDVLLKVGEQAVDSLPQFYRRLWAQGPAGTEVPLTVRRDGDARDLKVKSGNRYDYLQLKRSY